MGRARRWVCVLGGMIAAAPSQANGLTGSDAPSRIPIPARDFSAIVEDQSGTRLAVSQVTYNGEVFLYGNFGAGQVTVPFESIRDVRFQSSDEVDKRVALVSMLDGQSIRLVVEDDVPAYGKTTFGNYSITVLDLRMIQFLGPTSPAVTP
jgi:hypothetical protein